MTDDFKILSPNKPVEVKGTEMRWAFIIIVVFE